VVMRRIRH